MDLLRCVVKHEFTSTVCANGGQKMNHSAHLTGDRTLCGSWEGTGKVTPMLPGIKFYMSFMALYAQ